MRFKKYKTYEPVKLDDRQWPSRSITKAPIWCSVDLRDGNQALPIPMSIEEKTKMFLLLVDMGFKEIEVGFPSASQTEYDFLRKLIEDNLIPEDVTVQVLTQAREELIEKSFEALKGSKRAIVHVYNSTSVQQRNVVFNKNKQEIIDIALNGTRKIKELANKGMIEEVVLEYSPESFTGTELNYALEICEAVMDVWQPTPENKIIVNLPATVEMSTPNVFADRIEWFSKKLKNRDSVVLSVHTHNDRGTGVAASELALLAGADRVEGTLFGNGERTGNVDLITLGLNLFTQGINPEMKIDNLSEIVKVYEACTRMTVHPRHPYSGELVYTAFSGSHQDAIRKGLKAYETEQPDYWEVPYLPIDPADIGREYEAIIRINSQSGKGGIAYILENNFGYKLPKKMHPEIGKIVQVVTDGTGRELEPKEILKVFSDTYLNNKRTLSLKHLKSIIEDGEQSSKNEIVFITADVLWNQTRQKITGYGNGPIDAFFHALETIDIESFTLVDYEEHSLSGGSNAEAVAYIGLKDKNGTIKYGVGKDCNINIASIQAAISAINRFLEL